MDTIWIWLIIAVVVIALIAILAGVARRKAAARALEHNRHRAGKLREEAEVTGVEASRREADAAAARADAEEARLATEKLEREAALHEQHAGQVRDEAGERLIEADRLDPDIDPDGVDPLPEDVRDPRRDTF